jgi:signal transduction histidine kinase
MLFGKAMPLRNSTNLLRKDGKEIPIGDSAAPIFDSAGKVIGAIIIFRDVSQEKESQQLRSDFAYASHQLRTPVTQALWTIEVAKESKDREEIWKNLNIAEKSIRSVSKLTDQLIEASEIDQRMIITKQEVKRVSDIMDELLKSFNQKIQESDIVIEVGPISPTVSIETDAKILHRILWEVLDNAFNYSHPGGRIIVSHAIQNREFIFEIKDFGIGISKEEAPLIFTKFFRGRNFSTNEIPGAGLGLFIVREYVKLLQGKIWFSSEEGKGATFYISLPLLQSSS